MIDIEQKLNDIYALGKRRAVTGIVQETHKMMLDGYKAEILTAFEEIKTENDRFNNQEPKGEPEEQWCQLKAQMLVAIEKIDEQTRWRVEPDWWTEMSEVERLLRK